jgi:hypothetical protein
MEEQGILRDDPRLKSLLTALSQIAADQASVSPDGDPILIENLLLDKDKFIQ